MNGELIHPRLYAYASIPINTVQPFTHRQHHLKTTFEIVLMGISVCPKSDSPRKLPASAVEKSPLLPFARMIVNVGNALSVLCFTSICFIESNFTCTVAVPRFTGSWRTS